MIKLRRFELEVAKNRKMSAAGWAGQSDRAGPYSKTT